MSEHEKHVDEETASQKSEDTHGSKEESHKSDKKKKKNKKKKHHKKHTNGTPTPTTDTQTTFNIRDILTPEQRESLDKFREEIEKQTEITLKQRDRKWLTDMCLCRYLRARNYDIDKSLKLIIGTLKWRREYKPYKIRPEDVEIEMKNNGKMYGHGMDKQGRPILYLKPGNDNTGPEHKEVKVKYLVYSMEKAISLMDEAKGVEKVMWVIDHRGTNAFAGIGMMKIAKEIVDIMQNHYPERLSIAFNCNAPWSLSMFWKIIMPMLEEVTRQKLQFLDGKKFDAILQHIEAEQLEKEYGGSNPHVYNFEDFFKLQKETFKEEQFSDEEETVSNNN